VTNRRLGEGVPGATVWVDGSPELFGASDARGRYRIDAVPAGTHNLAVRAYGLETDFRMNAAVTAGSGLREDFLLEPVQVRTEKVVVLLVEFPGLPHDPTHTREYFDRILFGDAVGAPSLRNYVYEISKGRLDIEPGQYVGWMTDPHHPVETLEDSVRDDIVDWALRAADPRIDYAQYDLLHNRDLSPGPDGRVDHVLVIHAGNPRTITGKKTDLNPVCMFNTEHVDGVKTSEQVLVSESAPLGNFAHEFFHDMGDRFVQDLYMGGDPPVSTIGQWGLMSVGMYNPLDSLAPPYFEHVGHLPAHPMPYTILRWYHGALAREVLGQARTVAPGEHAEVVLDPQERGGDGTKLLRIPIGSNRALHVSVRQPLGFDRGLRDKGVVISRIDPALAGSFQLRGPVRVVDAHPGSPEPPYLHFKHDYDLDDAAFDLGEGEAPAHEGDGVKIQLLEARPDGSYRLAIDVRKGVAR
jgi:M6 family metalloprotease-like protein